MTLYTATNPTPDNPRVEGRFLAMLAYVPPNGLGPERVIDRAYIHAKHDPHATARARFGKLGNLGGRYKIRIRPVTARDLGMTRIPTRSKP